jgi:V/A-type H+-transporting ATPase subunit I
MSVWIPEEEKTNFESMLSKHQELSLFFKRAEEVSPRIEIPTMLVNNRFFQPFEILVNMYGVPSYNEIDPTAFFGLAYIFIFGAMFGDLGQGLVIMLAGLYLQKRRKMDFGAILSRIGIGSMIFGLCYDSLFGYEEIISKYIPLPYYVRPIDNINLVLILAVGAGVLLLLISYLYSIVNKLKIGDYEEGILGKNGINGVILFLMILYAAYGMILGGEDFRLMVPLAVIGINVILLIVKEPLINKLMGKDRLYSEAKSEYFVESGFNIFEIFLSLLSNCISFVRVGAFALNHVGLFIAFHTLANMIGGFGGNVAMFVIGNIVILGLEGLIVFIQGLRLFYYELFSKYYSGEGILFVPDRV